jgi:hypothetical protein
VHAEKYGADMMIASFFCNPFYFLDVMSDSLISGIVSGLLVAAFLLICRRFWNGTVIPWFEERVYKDAKIEGEWFSVYPTWQDKREEAILLTRHGHAVTGVITCTNGEDEGEQYDVHGSFRNMILPLVYEAHDRSKTDRGTITLKLTRNAVTLEGKLAYYHDPQDAIDNADVIWFRSKGERVKYIEQVEAHKKSYDDYRKRHAESESARQRLRRQTSPKRGENVASEPESNPKTQSRHEEKPNGESKEAS